VLDGPVRHADQAAALRRAPPRAPRPRGLIATGGSPLRRGALVPIT
jgi:hypothetical protein